MKLWIDDIRPAPSDYTWVTSVNEAKIHCCQFVFKQVLNIEVIDLDHDAGQYVYDGGDYIQLLNWLEEKQWDCSRVQFHIHSMNVVGVENMRKIIKKNGWKEA